MGNALEPYKCLGECQSMEAPASLIEVEMNGPAWDASEFGQSEMVAMSVASSPCIDSNLSVWSRSSSDAGLAGAAWKRSRGQQLVFAAVDDNAPLILEMFSEDAVHTSELQKVLSLACGRGSMNVVRELVAIGLDVNFASDASGMKPLHHAACAGHLGACEFLLDALADPSAEVRGQNALDLARRSGQEEAAQAIEKHMSALLNPSAYDGDLATRRAIVLPRVSAVLTEVVLKSDFAKETCTKNARVAKTEESKSTAESDDEYSYHTDQDTELISNLTTWVASDTQNRSSQDEVLEDAEKPKPSPEDAGAQSGQSPSKAVPETEAVSEVEAEAEAVAALEASGPRE